MSADTISTVVTTPAKFDKKPILVKRFKTTLCQTFEKTGRCPYVSRCMFAHGRRELRTAEMNIADGLTTDEAIKEWKQARAEIIAVKKAQHGHVAAPALEASCCSCHTPVRKESPAPMPIECSSNTSSRATTPIQSGSNSFSVPTAASDTGSSTPTTPSMHFMEPLARRGWRHDPYAAVVSSCSPIALAFGSVSNRAAMRV